MFSHSSISVNNVLIHVNSTLANEFKERSQTGAETATQKWGGAHNVEKRASCCKFLHNAHAHAYYVNIQLYCYEKIAMQLQLTGLNPTCTILICIRVAKVGVLSPLTIKSGGA